MNIEATNAYRRYSVSFTDENHLIINNLISMDEINTKTPRYFWEYIICLNEIADDIEQLKVGDSLYFRPNRQDANSKGIILRTI